MKYLFSLMFLCIVMSIVMSICFLFNGCQNNQSNNVQIIPEDVQFSIIINDTSLTPFPATFTLQKSIERHLINAAKEKNISLTVITIGRLHFRDIDQTDSHMWFAKCTVNGVTDSSAAKNVANTLIHIPFIKMIRTTSFYFMKNVDGTIDISDQH